MASTTPPLYDDKEGTPPPAPAARQIAEAENAPPNIPYVGSPTLVYQGVNPAMTFTVTFADQHGGIARFPNITASNKAQALWLVIGNGVAQQSIAANCAANDTLTVTVTQP